VYRETNDDSSDRPITDYRLPITDHRPPIMPRDRKHLLFIGVYNTVLALDTATGAEVWRAKLGGTSFVNVHWDGEELFASTKGEVWRLDPRNGNSIWHNKLKGLGFGAVLLASDRAPGASSGPGATAEALRLARSHTAAAT
jgi:outer membrane protein assembly factor BamB